MRPTRAICLSVIVLLTLVFLCGQEAVEEIVAIVNEDIVTLSQYRAEEESLYQMLKSQLQGEEFEKQYAFYKKNLLDRMITDLLLSQEAKKKDLNVDEQVRMWLENFKKENGIDSDEELRRGLRQQGINYEEFIRQLKENLLRQAVVYSEIQPSIVVEDSEVVNYYKLHPEEFTEPTEYKLRAIYIADEGKSEEELEAQKKEILGKIAAGEDFGTLASEYSEGPAKENQGDLGRLKKGELEKSLEQAVEKLKLGGTTPWLKVREGWYMLKLEEKKESRVKSFDEVRGDIEEELFNEKRQEKIEEYITKLKEKSYIKILKTDL